MVSFFLIGLLFGLRHALDADHLVAVATLVAESNKAEAVKQGVVWGLGHSITLLIFGGYFLYMDLQVPELTANFLELAVGLMLLILGINLMLRVLKKETGFSLPCHVDGQHPGKIPLRPLLIGLMHGLAGSGALILLVSSSLQSPVLGFAYIVVFGIGSMIGMGLLSIIVSIPFRQSKNFNGLSTGLSSCLGLTTAIIGWYLIYDIGVTQKLFIG